MTSDNATNQCATTETWLPVHVLRKAGGCLTGLSGLPVEVAGILKAFLESQLKHYDARYLKSEGTTYNYLKKLGITCDLFFLKLKSHPLCLESS